MDALYQRIDNLYEFKSGCRRYHGAVVAYTYDNAWRRDRAIEVPSYQLELIHGPGYPFA